MLYQNNEDTGEEYYSRADSRCNSVDYEAGQGGPSSSRDFADPACTVRPDGRPKRREDLLYQNNEDTGEEYYSRADSRHNSVDYYD